MPQTQYQNCNFISHSVEAKMEEKPKSDHAVFTFGRFNPPTTGHKKLVDKVVEHAAKHKADHYVFASHSHDPKKNPLDHAKKVYFMKSFFPHAHIHEGEGIKTAIDAVKHLHKKGYKKVTMMVGDDRQQEFHNLLHKYNGKDYHIHHLEVKSAGQRDPDSEGVEGMSASKMRSHAEKKNFKEFKKGVPNAAHAKELYHAVRKGMKLENYQKHFKVLFLVGGPGSGKDFILNSLMDESRILEMPLEKLYGAISHNKNIEELTNYPSMIVNGNADNFDKVSLTKSVLESMGYDTAMLYVYTSNEESKSRNDQRIINKEKTFSEEVRYERYVNSIQNMENFIDLFERFVIFDNSYNFSSVSSDKKLEMIGWLEELSTNISEFYNLPVLKSDAKIWLMENVRKNSLSLKESGGAPGGIGSKDGSAKDGIMAKDYPKKEKGSPYMYPKSDSPKGKQKSGKKAATPPPDFFDQRMGAVPSGGIGLTVSHNEKIGPVIQEKSFERFRKNITSLLNNIDKE